MSDETDPDLLPEIDPALLIEPAGNGGFVVRDGDSMSSIADGSGHFWETIWSHPANASLKEAREDPETLFPGDKVTIPALREKTEARETDLIHTFKRRGVPVQISYRAASQAGSPFPDKAYVLKVGSRRYEGRTDSDGALEHWITPSSKTGILTIELEEAGYPKTLDVALDIGALPPADTLFGIQARLRNLGYDLGEIDGVFGHRTFGAVKRFQAAAGLEATGVPDADLISALEDAHGS